MRKIPHWLEAYTEGESLDILCDLGEAAAMAAATPAGSLLASLIRKGKFREVCEFKLDLQNTTAHELRCLRQAMALFQKLEFLDLGIDKSAVAVQSLLETESRCRDTNEIWQGWHQGWIKFDPELNAVFHLAQGHIQRILGRRPTLDELKLRFGPGATSLTKKRESSVKRKLGKGVSCSNDLVGWARALLQEMPHLAELHAETSVVSEEEFWGIVPVLIHGATISFVRKNYKTDRTTETQPTLNGMLQLAIGDLMFERASLVAGLNLRDQTLNQRLACIGSLTGEVATLDLKSASNCIAVRLVQSLFPEDWFSLLKAARVGITMIPGVGEVSLEMFSGMGNGFTFPLQSILFWALARASATVLKIDSPVVSVYGDDIIVDTACAPLLKRVLACAGLLVNEEKSFVDGQFRESCGADYFAGIDVRPVYVKEILTPAVLFSLHNGLFRKGNFELAERVRRLVHPSLALVGPDDFGDGHLVSFDWKLSARPKGRRHGFEGFTFQTFARSSKRDWTYHPGDRILHTYAVHTRSATSLFSEAIPGLSRKFTDPNSNVVVRRPWGDLRFVRAWATGHAEVEEPSLPIPFGTDASSFGPVAQDPFTGLGWQGHAKACTFPGTDGYKKVTIYTLG